MPTQFSSATIRHGIGTALTPLSSPHAAAGVAVAVAASGGALPASVVCPSGQIDGSSAASPTSSSTTPITGKDLQQSPLGKKSGSSPGSDKDADKKELNRNKEGSFLVQ